jgi:ribosome biogenesis protein ERB1
VRSVSADPSGQWLASGGDDGTLRLWEVASGRCMRTWDLGAPVVCVAWCPAAATRLLAAAAGKSLLLLPSGVGGEAAAAAAAEALRLEGGEVAGQLATWRQRADGGVEVAGNHEVRHLAWHARGDYFSTVAPTGATQVGRLAAGGGWRRWRAPGRGRAGGSRGRCCTVHASMLHARAPPPMMP